MPEHPPATARPAVPELDSGDEAGRHERAGSDGGQVKTTKRCPLLLNHTFLKLPCAVLSEAHLYEKICLLVLGGLFFVES